MEIHLSNEQYKKIFEETDEQRENRINFLEELDKKFDGVMVKKGNKTFINVRKYNKNCKKLKRIQKRGLRRNNGIIEDACNMNEEEIDKILEEQEEQNV